MRSTTSHSFSQVPQANIQRSSFNRNHGLKTTFNAGYLVPIFVDEALPGDTFNCKLHAFVRMATPLKPIMDNMFLETFFFSVPVRLIWSNWQRFNGEQPNPGDSTSFYVPQMTCPNDGVGIVSGSLSDYLGLPVGIPNITFNSLWHRAYNFVHNEWFRDENLQTRVVVDTDDGPDTYTDYVLLKRGKRHDYFTSCLPWPQKGTAVTIPLGTSAPVIGIGKYDGVFPSAGAENLRESDGDTRQYAHKALIKGSGTDDQLFYVEGTLAADGYPMIRADLSAATAATINSLRQAFQIQVLYERDARGGTRYIEILKSHWGVTSPDARVQRPEYIGGGSSPVTINPVAQTTPLPAGGTLTPQGNLAAFGTAHVSGHGFTKSFVEHCVLIGLACVRADLTYQQGMDRMFSRRTRWDFAWPALMHLGEQSVLNKEIYCDGSANDDLVFGYQERYAEYRYKPSKITGLFRSNVAGAGATSLEVWHLAQDFGALPTLAATFIQENPPVSRVIATPTEPQFLYDSYVELTCARAMPVYSVPGLIDHF